MSQSHIAAELLAEMRSAMISITQANPSVLERLKADSERLSWMIFYSAKVVHSNDSEYCCVVWHDEDGEHRTKLYGDANEAIDAAIHQQGYQ